jgi:hypothetical protein
LPWVTPCASQFSFRQEVERWDQHKDEERSVNGDISQGDGTEIKQERDRILALHPAVVLHHFPVVGCLPHQLGAQQLSGKWQSGKATPVLSRLAADFTGWEQDAHKFEAQVENVIRALRSDEGAREKPPQGKL